jgi:hypothetical protein
LLLWPLLIAINSLKLFGKSVEEIAVASVGGGVGVNVNWEASGVGRLVTVISERAAARGYEYQSVFANPGAPVYEVDLVGYNDEISERIRYLESESFNFGVFY